jgi:hypothetical protein
MNCIDFRREALAQPLRLAPAAGEHAAGCDACGPFLERLREQEAELYQALCVPVPDGLADRILVSQGLRGRRRPWLWAIAATFVLTFLVGLLARPLLTGRELAGEALAHVAHEPQSFGLVSRHAPDLLPKALAAQGASLARNVGAVTYATLCPMEAARAHHLVLATPEGPVTLLLLPDDPVRRSRTVVERDGMTAISLPASRGSIAIVAPTRAQALALERSLVLS